MKKIFAIIIISSLIVFGSCQKKSVTCVCEDWGRGGVEIFNGDLNAESDCYNKEMKYNALSMYGEVKCKVK